MEGFIFADIFIASKDYGRALMDVLGLNVQNIYASTIHGLATGLLRQVCHGKALVQQSQLSAL